MNAKLVSVTKALVEQKELSAEELIVYVARVSNPSSQLNSDTSDKLIAFLVKNKHWSPFEMVDMTVEIVTSRGIAQQILRHRSFSFQEFSQRYAEVTDFEAIQLRKTGATNRQSSLEPFDPTIQYETTIKIKNEVGTIMKAGRASDILVQHIIESERIYKELLKAGVAKESARFVLPITTQTKIYMKGSVRSWIHYLQIRCDQHTQLEHRQIALGILDIFKSNFPNISKALEL